MSTTETRPAIRSFAGPAIGTALLTCVALLWAYYVDTPWKAEARDWGIDAESGLVGLLWIAGFVALGVGVVFGVVVRSALERDPGRTARTGLILAVVGAPLTVLAFWTGLPIVLGAAAMYLGLNAHNRFGRATGTAVGAIGLGLLVAAVALYFCIAG